MEPLWHQAFACLSSYTVVHLSNILWKFWALSKLQKTNDKKKSTTMWSFSSPADELQQFTTLNCKTVYSMLYVSQ